MGAEIAPGPSGAPKRGRPPPPRPQAYGDTSSVPTIPASSCPGMVHTRRYVPAAKSTLAVWVSPGWMDSTLTPVPSTTKLCSTVPTFLIWNVSLPGPAVRSGGTILNSLSSTVSVVPGGVGTVDPGWPRPPHAASKPAASSRTIGRRLSFRDEAKGCDEEEQQKEHYVEEQVEEHGAQPHAALGHSEASGAAALQAPGQLLRPVTHQVVPLTVEAVAVWAAGDEGSVGPGAQRLLQPVRAHETRAGDTHDVHAGMRQQAPLRVE